MAVCRWERLGNESEEEQSGYQAQLGGDIEAG